MERHSLPFVHSRMNLVLLLILVALVVLGVLWVWRAPKRSQSRNLLPGVRREAAQNRQIPKSNERLFTREVTTGKRRFFFDVDQSERGKVLKISELETGDDKKEKAFTLVVFEREIKGFQRALNDAVREMGVEG